LYDGRVVPTTVETLDITLKPTLLLILMLGKRMLISRYAEVVLMKAEALNELDQTPANPFIKPN
jgi:hypothetical protein